MTRRIIRILSTLILVSILLSACSATAGSTSSQPLRVGWSLWPGWYPLVIAQDQGFFEKNGVSVELVFYDEYAEIMPALGSGMIDGGGLALGDALMNDVAEDVKIVLITDASNGADQIVVSPEITSVQDLAGKRIGLQSGTYAEVLVQEMLKSQGLTTLDVTFVEIPVEDIPNAIPDIIDAGHTFEPYASQARAKGFNPVFTSADTPGLLLDIFAFRKDTLLNYPNEVRGFMNAWFEGVKYWQENPEEGNAIISQAMGVPESEISLEGIKIYSQAENLAAFQESNLTTSIYYPAKIENQFLLDSGIISYPVQIDAEFLDPSFLKQASEE